jgi:endo-1,4-beta-xylanase
LTRRAALATGAATGLGGWRQPSTLKAAAARTGRIYGCAIEPINLDRDPAFRGLIARQSGLLVAENATKWDALRPAADVFDFSRADRFADQAQEMNILARGHALIWHEAIPAWVPKDMDRAAGERLFTEHIRRVVGRYAGRIQFWDVVIEAIEGVDGREDQLRVSPWLKAMGPDYLNIAFETAHAADPKAKLALCDYGLEYDDIPWNTWKRDRMLWLLKRLLAQGVPVHALGLQSHLADSRPGSFGKGLADFLKKVADLGLDIWITELDVDDLKTTGDINARDRTVTEVYKRYLDTVLREPAVKMVATWGISDRYSAKDYFYPRPDGQPQRPLPFDRDFQPKPAFDAMMSAF